MRERSKSPRCSSQRCIEMIEMYHPLHARLHPCAAEENELERLLKQGWVRSREELEQSQTFQTKKENDIDEFDARVDAMLEQEAREEKRMARRRGSSTPEIR